MMPFLRPLRSLTSALLVVTAVGVRAQEAPPLYAVPGRQLEPKQNALTELVANFHRAFYQTLRAAARRRLLRLAPPPPVATGYHLGPGALPPLPPQRTPKA